MIFGPELHAHGNIRTNPRQRLSRHARLYVVSVGKKLIMPNLRVASRSSAYHGYIVALARHLGGPLAFLDSLR
jgi:hypothetical protein